MSATPTSPQLLVYAGEGDDRLVLGDGKGLGVGGRFRGGPGTDTLDHSASTTP